MRIKLCQETMVQISIVFQKYDHLKIFFDEKNSIFNWKSINAGGAGHHYWNLSIRFTCFYFLTEWLLWNMGKSRNLTPYKKLLANNKSMFYSLTMEQKIGTEIFLFLNCGSLASATKTYHQKVLNLTQVPKKV